MAFIQQLQNRESKLMVVMCTRCYYKLEKSSTCLCVLMAVILHNGRLCHTDGEAI